MQETSMQHIINLKASFWDLEKEHLTWVLLRKKVDIIRMPILGETLTIKTYPTGFERVFAYRDYRVWDEKGAMIAYANSFWSLINLKTRRIARIPEYILDFYYRDTSIYLPRVSSKLDDLERIDLSDQRKVRHYHLDFNDHMNNVEYLYWLLDPLDKIWMDQNMIKSITIHYKGEAFCGDVLTSDIQINGMETIHKVHQTKTNKPVILAKIEWDKRT